MQKDKFGHGGGGGKHFSKTFSIFYMLNSKKEFSTHIFNWYLSNEKTAFVDKSRVQPTIFFIEKISFSLKLFWSFLWAILY